jgi:hypothetical protein
MDSFASTSPPRTALREPDAPTTDTSPITKLNLPAAARLSEIGSAASTMRNTIFLNMMDFMVIS